MEGDELEYAGFWVRFGATLIDAVLVFAVTMPNVGDDADFLRVHADKTPRAFD